MQFEVYEDHRGDSGTLESAVGHRWIGQVATILDRKPGSAALGRRFVGRSPSEHSRIPLPACEDRSCTQTYDRV